MLTKYISYAKQLVPILSTEAADYVSKCFVEMRNLGRKYNTKNVHVTATMRQMMSMMRLAEAHAKVHLRLEVLVEDVEEAYRLIKVALQQSATDPKTGRINMDLLMAGYAAPTGDEDHLQTALLEYLESSASNSFGYRDLFRMFKMNKELTKSEFDLVLNQLDVNQQIHWDKSNNLIKLLRD